MDQDYAELDVLAEVAHRTAPFLAGDAPVFGSPEWLDLDAGDPRVTAAVVRAALAWWRMGEPIEDVEVRAEAAEDKASAVAISAGMTDSRGSGMYRQTHAELERVRRQGAVAVEMASAEETERWVATGSSKPGMGS